MLVVRVGSWLLECGNVCGHGEWLHGPAWGWVQIVDSEHSALINFEVKGGLENSYFSYCKRKNVCLELL